MKRRQFIASIGRSFGAACAGGVLLSRSPVARAFADGFEDPTTVLDTFVVTGFGSKTSLPYFEDFESFAPGPAVSPVGRIQLSNAVGQTISTTRAFEGTRSLENLYSANDFPKNYLDLSGTRPRFYFCCHLHYTGSTVGSHVWKQGRIGAGAVYGGLPHAGEAWTAQGTLPSSFGGEIVNSNGITSWSEHNAVAANAEAIYDLDRWMFYEFEHYSGTVNNADSVTRATVDGVPVLNWDQRPYLTSASPQLPTWFLTAINGLDGSPAVTVNMDLVYADESRARVVFTNAANYGASTQFNVQPIESYADTQVVTRRVIPSFSLGQTVHVHAWSDAGVYQYLGTRLLA